MCSGDVTKNSVPLRPAVASFLLTARNDVIFLILMKDNGTSLTRKNIKNNLKNLSQLNRVYSVNHAYPQTNDILFHASAVKKFFFDWFLLLFSTTWNVKII